MGKRDLLSKFADLEVTTIVTESGHTHFFACDDVVDCVEEYFGAITNDTTTHVTDINDDNHYYAVVKGTMDKKNMMPVYWGIGKNDGKSAVFTTSVVSEKYGQFSATKDEWSKFDVNGSNATFIMKGGKVND